MKNPMTVFELLNDSNDYAIPLYQRNFSWTYKEIAQLIIDILDAIREKKPDYFVGTLVICKNGNKFDVIDGQQRFTALYLILFALQNECNVLPKIKKLNLSFTARESSSKTLASLLINKNPENIDDEVLLGYNDTLAEVIEYVGIGEYCDITFDMFYEYLLNNVKIFINEVPNDTDVNLYFERFNSRGEQLEFHEIIKADLMQQLYNETNDTAITQKFAKIWESCSDFETPCIKYYKKKKKGADADEEREIIFRCEWAEYSPGQNSWRYNYELKDNIYSKILINKENKFDLLSKYSYENIDKEDETPDESNRYRCIINFNTFLYYVLYLTDGYEAEKIQLDDKKLIKNFKVKMRNKEWILKFGKNLLQCKFIFDNFIIRRSLETTARLREDQWFLHKAYREDKNDRPRGHLYVQTRFDRNSFECNNDEIIKLQSMFAVTFTAYKDTKWLYSTMKYLFENAKDLNLDYSGKKFYNFFEDLAKKRYKEMLGERVEAKKLRYDNRVPIYAFNLMDYVIWKNRESVKKVYKDINFNDFEFTYRRSIEHWYPQNPNEDEKNYKMSKDLLHSFGNLCLIVASQNSEFGRLYPGAKLANWRNIFNTQSLKLQMMAQITAKLGSWEERDRERIKEFESELLNYLSSFING